MSKRRPNPDPGLASQVGRPAGGKSTDSTAQRGSDSGAPTTGAPSPPLASTSLNWYERRALGLLRRLGADPDGAPPQDEGRWPSTWQSFLWDLAPHQVAPARDGVVLPLWKEPKWLADLTDDEVEAARHMVRAEMDRCLESVSGIELKATRLLTPFVALLTGAVALTTFQAAAIELSLTGLLAAVGATFGIAGVGFLLVGMLRGLDADTRLSTSRRATLEQELSGDPRLALRSDHQGIEAAKFVLRNKGSRILFARAAISRGLAVLLVSASIAALGLALSP